MNIDYNPSTRAEFDALADTVATTLPYEHLRMIAALRLAHKFGANPHFNVQRFIERCRLDVIK